MNYSFDGHQIERKRGVRVLTSEELALKDVSLTYVSRLMGREFTKAPLFRKVLQSICWQVSSGQEVVVVGNIQPDQTVKGGTGWGAEFAKICNKPLLVFDQEQDGWYRWLNDAWVKVEEPVIEHTHFTATGTRFMEANGAKPFRICLLVRSTASRGRFCRIVDSHPVLQDGCLCEGGVCRCLPFRP